MGLKVSLLSDYGKEMERWEERKRVAMDRAREDLGLIVPLVEDYYDARKPQGDRVVYEWEVGRGVEAFRRFLDGFVVVCRQYPGTRVVISRGEGK